MGELATWYRKRLRVLARGPRTYGAFDTVNAALVKRQLIIPTTRHVSLHRREYEITDAGRTALRQAGDGEAPRPPTWRSIGTSVDRRMQPDGIAEARV